MCAGSLLVLRKDKRKGAKWCCLGSGDLIIYVVNNIWEFDKCRIDSLDEHFDMQDDVWMEWYLLWVDGMIKAHLLHPNFRRCALPSYWARGRKKKKSHATCQLPVVGRKSTLARRFAAHNGPLARSLDSFFFSAREPSSNQNHNRSHSLFKNKKLVSHMMVPHLRLGCILFWQLWTHLEWCCVLVKWIFLLEIWELMRFWLIDWLTFFFYFFTTVIKCILLYSQLYFPLRLKETYISLSLSLSLSPSRARSRFLSPLSLFLSLSLSLFREFVCWRFSSVYILLKISRKKTHWYIYVLTLLT